VIYYVAVVTIRTNTKGYGIRFLAFITAVVCHTVIQQKVGFLQLFITDDISKIFLALTVRTPLLVRIVVVHKPERAAASVCDGLNFVEFKICSNNLY